METSDIFRTVAGDSEGIYREKGSKFIAFAFPIADEEQFKERALLIAKQHPASRHVCYGWVLGDNGEHTRANDDGEPNGTAGKPILRYIQGNDLTYCAVAVVRYFGGTLLGKGGLVQAYGESARLALESASIVERIVRDTIQVVCNYSDYDAIKQEVLNSDGRILETAFTEKCVARIALPKSAVDPFIEKWALSDATFTRTDP